ncbi:MAG: FkbM family methyltransferase [Sedimentisphaerales bacterium]|nr:FkbM family methyltransferase [Sedimentisphaerales bacterium]
MDKATVISMCGKAPVVGTLLRKIARRYPEGSVATIRNGPLRGYQWRRSHRYVSGYWLGIYELPIQECLTRELRPGDVFYDIGANGGFLTLLGSKCVGPEGRVFSFEPLPENIRSIRSQLELNATENCAIVEAAVSDRQSTIAFCGGKDTSTAHIVGTKEAEDGAVVLSVDTTSLDDFVQRAAKPDFIKMDVEGAELLALKGARQLLESDRPPRMLIEFHGEQLKQDSCALLCEYGYSFHSLDGRTCGGIPEERHVLCLPPQCKA